MADPQTLTKYTNECYHCQEMFSAYSTELLVIKIQAHYKKNHDTSDETPKKGEEVPAVERDCLPKIDKASREMTMEE